MLTWYDNEDDCSKSGLPIIRDVEMAFNFVTLQGTEVERKMIELIEHGTYNDNLSFIDRFGYKLPLDCLSTSCKAALVVANSPDKVVWLIECGRTGRDVIVSLCARGNILLPFDDITLRDYADSIDVMYSGHRFQTIGDLNKYLEWGELL